jgi:hypothetical protein
MHVDHVLRPTVDTFDLDGMAFIIFFSRSEASRLLGHAHSVRAIFFPESYRKHGSGLGQPQLGERDGSREAQAAAISRHNSFLVVFRHDSATDRRAS